MSLLKRMQVLSYIPNSDYEKAGAHIAANSEEVFRDADVVLKVNGPKLNEKKSSPELQWMKEGASLIAPLHALSNRDLVLLLAQKKITAFSLELLPRIARAQSMDILSSMSNLAGYKSVVMAADHLGKIFPLLTTAAGTIQPVKIIVIGAGVAGLQAIATARRLGGVVIAFDTRPTAEEQVKSLGADFVSVVIAIFNAYGGLTGAVMGFMLGNRIQIITGALDGASGFILAMLMCKAMNRSITNVLFGAFGTIADKADKKSAISDNKSIQEISVEDALQLFEQAQYVIVAPGYGMAASQAHHALKSFIDKLKANGVTVKYAIHPVAGRMPGHMNVLLAEANVPYTDLFDMEEINPEFPNADIALVVGANDVTNPSARTVKSSPIYGMPILDVDKAKKVIVLKRSMNPGFSGVENDLYNKDNTWMLFGDAKESLSKLAYGYKRSWG